VKIGDLIKTWQKQPSEALRALILALDDREPLEALRDLEALKTAQVAERLATFRTRARDPRVTRALEQLVLNVKWSSDGSKPMWRAVFELAGRTADPRLRSITPEFKVRPAMHDWLSKQWAAAVEGLPRAFDPAADETKWRQALAALPAIKKPVGARDEAALYANVYATPADDAPRLVLADFLSERGDARGEFITLQCGARDEKREKALLKANEKKWLGALAPVLAKEVEWKRGFPWKGRALFKAQRDAEKYGALPEWATFEELEWSEPGAASSTQRRWTLHFGPAFRHLRRAVNPFFTAMLEGDAVYENLETLSVSLAAATDVAQFVAAAPTRFPKLHTLQLRWAPSPGWFTGVTRFGHVKTLELGSTRDLPQWIAELEKLPIETLRFERTFTFRRNAAGQLALLTVTNTDSRHAQSLPNLLPAGLAESVQFDGEPLPDHVRQQLEAKAGSVVRTARRDDELGELTAVRHFTWLDDRHLAIPSSGRLSIVDVDAPKAPRVLRAFPCERSTAIATLDGGKAVLLASQTRLITVDAQTGAQRSSIEHAYTGGNLLQFSRDRARVSRGKAGVFELQRGVELEAPKGAQDDTRTADDRFWVRWDAVNETYVARWPGARLGVPLEDGAAFSGLFVVLDEALIARTSTGLVKWDARSGKRLAEIASGDGAIGPGVTATPDLRFAFTDDDPVLVVKLDDLTEVARVKLPGKAQALALSPSGTRLAANVGGALHVLAVTS
jgi:uncharacterized protein (TIGR02996 family)